MLEEVFEPGGKGGQVGLAELGDLHAAVILQRANGGDEHRKVRNQPRLPAFDIQEFLRAQVRAEPGFGHRKIGEAQAELGGRDAVAAVRDVAERPAMDEGGIALERLNEVRLQAVTHNHRHRAVGLQVAGGNQFSAVRISHDHPPQPRLQFSQRVGKAKRGHDFRSRRNVEARFARHGIGRAAQPDDDLAQRPLVHVHDAAPDDPARVNAQAVAKVQVIVQQRGEEVVGGSDDVEIAVKMKVDFLHRRDLGVAAAGSAALHSETGADRWFAQAQDGLPAQAVEGVGQADACGGLAFAGGRGMDRRNENELAGRRVFQSPVEVRRSSPWSSRTAQGLLPECRLWRRPPQSVAISLFGKSRWRSAVLMNRS